MKKRIAAAAMAVIMAVSMTGCAGKTADTKGSQEAAGAQGGTEAAGTQGGTGKETAKIGVIFGTGGLGDKNFNDMAYAGIMKAQEDLGIEFDYVEPNAISDFVPLGRQFSETEEYDLLIAVGSDQQEAVKEIAEEFPDQRIALVDGTEEITGVSTLQTEWCEQTFLAGVIAGLGTKSSMDKANADNVIGVIIGADQPNLREGIVGFTAGAKYVNPDVEVLEGVVGAFNDPGKAKRSAFPCITRVLTLSSVSPEHPVWACLALQRKRDATRSASDRIRMRRTRIISWPLRSEAWKTWSIMK